MPGEWPDMRIAVVKKGVCVYGGQFSEIGIGTLKKVRTSYHHL